MFAFIILYWKIFFSCCYALYTVDQDYFKGMRFKQFSTSSNNNAKYNKSNAVIFGACVASSVLAYWILANSEVSADVPEGRVFLHNLLINI